jgi:hypothetical protein
MALVSTPFPASRSRLWTDDNDDNHDTSCSMSSNTFRLHWRFCHKRAIAAYRCIHARPLVEAFIWTASELTNFVMLSPLPSISYSSSSYRYSRLEFCSGAYTVSISIYLLFVHVLLNGVIAHGIFQLLCFGWIFHISVLVDVALIPGAKSIVLLV